MENFIFLCSTLIKMTWLMCLIHSLLRWLLKLIAYSMKSLKMVRPAIRDKLDWYVDASALFLSYKVYSLLMFVLLYSFVGLHGNTTLMVRDVPAERGVFGGDPYIVQLWNSELTCDFFVILYHDGCGLHRRIFGSVDVVQVRAHELSAAAASETLRVCRLGLDDRHGSARGWPDAALLCRGRRHGHQLFCWIVVTIDVRLRPSGLVSLAGDYIFLNEGFSKPPVEFHFSVKKALVIGLCGNNSNSRINKSLATSKYAISNANEDCRTQAKPKMTDLSSTSQLNLNVQKESKSLFGRQLRVFTSGRYGRMLLVDENEPGRIPKTADGAMNEFVVQDALSFMNILDTKSLVGDKKLRIR